MNKKYTKNTLPESNDIDENGNRTESPENTRRSRTDRKAKEDDDPKDDNKTGFQIKDGQIFRNDPFDEKNPAFVEAKPVEIKDDKPKRTPYAPVSNSPPEDKKDFGTPGFNSPFKNLSAPVV